MLSFTQYTHLPQAIKKIRPPEEIEMLQAVDIAQAVLYAVTQPRRAAVNEVLVNITEIP